MLNNAPKKTHSISNISIYSTSTTQSQRLMTQYNIVVQYSDADYGKQMAFEIHRTALNIPCNDIILNKLWL